MAPIASALFLLAALPTLLSARMKTTNGPHKCTIAWELPERGVAQVAFPVSSCRIQCKLTFTDNHYDKKFANAFNVEQHGNVCHCSNGDHDVLKFIGDCGEQKDAQDHCFNDYKILRTDTFEKQPGRESSNVVHHHDQYGEKTFSYNTCEENACPDGDCNVAEFPSIMAGRSDEEKLLVADLLQKIAHGDGDKLTGQEHSLVDALSSDDIAEIMFTEVLVETGSTSGVLTVGQLRDIYEVKLKGTGVSVDHLLAVAGFKDDNDEVDLDGFKQFVQPDCQD